MIISVFFCYSLHHDYMFFFLAIYSKWSKQDGNTVLEQSFRQRLRVQIQPFSFRCRGIVLIPVELLAPADRNSTLDVFCEVP